MYDIIIVGAGPAGLTAALYALRANKNVLVLEAKTYGGQIVNASKVENYPAIPTISGFDFATSLYKQVTDLGATIKYETVLRVEENKKVTTNKGEYDAKAIIIATGSENRKLNITDEAKFVGRGVSYCATCDGNFYRNKTVAVVGGGDTAVEDAVYLADIAEKVYLIHRRDEFRASALSISKLESRDNVEFITNANVTKLNGDDFLKSIEVTSNDGNVQEIEINGLFIAVGQEPKNQIFANILTLDKFGYIQTTDGVKTDIKGIYVAGDTRVKELRQLTTAVGDGALAATIAIREMNKE